MARCPLYKKWSSCHLDFPSAPLMIPLSQELPPATKTNSTKPDFIVAENISIKKIYINIFRTTAQTFPKIFRIVLHQLLSLNTGLTCPVAVRILQKEKGLHALPSKYPLTPITSHSRLIQSYPNQSHRLIACHSLRSGIQFYKFTQSQSTVHHKNRHRTKPRKPLILLNLFDLSQLYRNPRCFRQTRYFLCGR